MTLDQPKVAARAIYGDGFAHSDLEVRLASIAGPDMSAIDGDGDLTLGVGKFGTLVGTDFNEAVKLIGQFCLNPRGYAP